MLEKLLVGSSSGYLSLIFIGFSPKVPNNEILLDAENGLYLYDFSDFCLLNPILSVSFPSLSLLICILAFPLLLKT